MLSFLVFQKFTMTSKRFVYSSFLVLVSLWWGWTVLVDMFIIRTVFSVIENFFQAGDLGVAVFSKLNNLELIVSTGIVTLLSYQVSKNKNALKLLVLSLGAWVISLVYFSFLTPRLTEMTNLWKKADALGVSGLNGIADIQQAHQFYHNLYIATDVIKLVLLTIILIIGIVQEEKWT